MRKLIQTRAAARILNLSEKWVRRMADSGALPVAERADRGVRLFDECDVKRIAAERHERLERASA